MNCIKYLKNNILINQQTAFLIVLFVSFSFCASAYSLIFTYHTWVAFSVLIVCISFCVVGGFFGFIFGMPKYVKSDSKKVMQNGMKTQIYKKYQIGLPK